MRYLRRLLEAISLFFAGFAAVCAWVGNDMAAAGCLLFAGVSAVVRALEGRIGGHPGSGAANVCRAL